MKKHIPNILTFGNLFCGCIAVKHIFIEDYKLTLLWVVLGIICDFFDGFVARMLNVSSEIGKQLDSLADMVTAGLVPGVVVYKLLCQTTNLPLFFETRGLCLLGFLITLASAYRLAKFNIDTRQTTGFIGLPTPANALFICSLAIISQETDIKIFKDLLANFWVLFVIILLSCYLLNSEIQLFALKFKNFRFEENKQKYIFLIFSIVALALLKILAVPVIVLAYILFSVLWKEIKY